MGLLSIFKRGAAPAASADASGDAHGPVQAARTRARRRLIGAVVLVGLAIIGFPLVFETQPRPIPVDIPIELPRKENATPLTMPPARASSGQVIAPAAAPLAEAPSAAGTADVVTEAREDAGREIVAPPGGASAGGPATASSPLARSASDIAAAPATKASSSADGARAQALLEGKANKPAAVDGRFVVQVGAFADAGAARETRLKVEKLGLKTYTQVASTPNGNRIRVRAGPFASRDEANKALAKARGVGLSGVVLTL